MAPARRPAAIAMTDQGVGEIYAIVQKALSGGQGDFRSRPFPSA